MPLEPAERPRSAWQLPLPPLAALHLAELGPAVMADDPCEAASATATPPGPRKYYRARYHEPTIGRFISEDPIGLAGGVNLYAYVRNSPLKFTDPLGQAPIDLKTVNCPLGSPEGDQCFLDCGTKGVKLCEITYRWQPTITKTIGPTGQGQQHILDWVKIDSRCECNDEPPRPLHAWPLVIPIIICILMGGCTLPLPLLRVCPAMVPIATGPPDEA